MEKEMNYKTISLTVSILVISFAIAFYAVGWEEPTEDPPAGSIDIPINIGPIGQNKEGALGVEGLFQANNSAYLATLGGNVGIGTSSPVRKLQVYGEGTTGVIEVNSGDGWGRIMNHDANLAIAAKGDIVFWSGSFADGDEIMTIINNGNVGIGTTSPGGKLHITEIGQQGIGLETKINIGPDVNDYFSHIDQIDGPPLVNEKLSIVLNGQKAITITPFSPGNIGVGIGTTSPSEKLDVVGNIEASGSICANGGADCIGGGFPDPDFDSGWMNVPSNGSSTTLTHNLGTMDFKVVSIIGKATGENPAWPTGTSSSGNSSNGNSITVVDNNNIKIWTYIHGAMWINPEFDQGGAGRQADQVRIKIWK